MSDLPIHSIAERLRIRAMGELDFIAAREIERLVSLIKSADQQSAELQSALQHYRFKAVPAHQRISDLIHYPHHWDTAAYPTLSEAMIEVAARSGCSVCKNKNKIHWCGDPYDVDCDDPKCDLHSGMTKP